MLQKLGFTPGFNKQVTSTGAEAQWTGGDYVRFRYGSPEKIGGWSQLGESKLTGASRALHHFDDNAGIKFAAIGTNRILYIYSGGIYYDIHPLVNPSGTAITNAFTTTNGSPTITLTFGTSHGFVAGDIILFGDSTTFTSITNSDFVAADFADKKFMVTSVPTATTLTITMSSNESGSGATTSGGITYYRYYHVGPAQQLGGYGWSIGQYGGTVAGEASTTLNGALLADTAGTGGSGTAVTLTDASAFPDTGTILVGSELITYTGKSTNDLTGITRGASGTAVSGTTGQAHSDGATSYDAADYVGWGSAASGDYVIKPGMWILDNYGTKLIALIYNGACFEWESASATATATRATVMSNAPAASRHMLVSPTDRHLIFFGTVTGTDVTVADNQNDMFIRWSDQESINDSASYTVTANNTAGTQRLANGSKIMGAKRGRDTIYVWTDTALYLMRFVGAPFTFAFDQAGTNCGLIGKNAAVEVDGTAFWMSENGFFSYSGQLQTMPCLVEDYVFDDLNSTPRDLINCGLNNLYGEVTWYYCTSSSDVVDRMVTYNYLETLLVKKPVWYTGSLARTAWADSAVFDKPHACYYTTSDDTSFDVTGNTDGITIYYEQETGTDQVTSGGVTTAVAANIISGDFDITQKRTSQGQMIGAPDLRGDGEYIMKIRRFIPDFITQTGDTQVTLMLRNYPSDTAATSSYGPFTITSSTDKVDTRARARAIAFKVANTGASGGSYQAQDWKLGTFRLDIQPDGRR